MNHKHFKNRILMASILCALLIGASFTASAQNAAEMLSDSFRDAIAKVKPAVVSIAAEKIVKPSQMPKQYDMNEMPDIFRRFFGEEFFKNPQNFNPKRDWQGSGVIFTPEGDVLTNNHVVDGADTITVTLDDGRTVEADMETVKTDPGSDLAIFKLKENGDYPYAALGDSDELQVGDWVLAIGSPFGLNQTVTEGIVSAKGRTSSDVPIGGNEFFVKDYIQTSAAINPGNSGGPLINLRGEVIGVNNAIQTAGVPGNLGIGFAIPSNLAKSVADSLKQFGEVKRGYIGITMLPLEANDVAKWYKQEFGVEQGVFVHKILNDSPAEKAGLKAGDLIVEFNGKKVISGGQLTNMVTAFAPGTEVELTIFRKGKRMEIELTLDQRPDNIALSTSEKYLGLSIETLTPEVAEKLGHDKDMQGVRVVAVQPGSSAAQVGIQANDVITEVNMNGDPVTNSEQFEKFVTETVEEMKDKGEKEHLILLHVFIAKNRYPDKWVAPTIRLDDETDENK